MTEVAPLAATPVPGEAAPYPEDRCGRATTTLDGVVVDVDATLLAWTGRDRAQVVGRAVTGLLTSVGRLTWETQVAPLVRLRGRVDPVDLELCGGAGPGRPVLAACDVLPGGSGGPDLLRITAFDASARLAHERGLLLAKTRAERSEARLRTLHQVTTDLAAAGDVVEQVLAGTLAQALGATAASVWRTGPSGAARRVAGTRPATGDSPLQAPGAVSALVEVAVRTEDVVVVESLDHAAAAHPHLLDGMLKQRLQTLVVVPLLGDGPALGAYCVAFARSRPPTQEDLGLHRRLGRQAGQALQRAQRQGELGQLALQDPVTGLPNRTLLLDRLQHALARAVRVDARLTLVAVQLRGLAVLTDGRGPEAADQVLLQLAHRLGAEVRPSDTLARLSADELVVLCEGLDEQRSSQLVARLAGAVARPVALGEDEREVEVSVASVTHHATAGSVTSAVDLLRELSTELHGVQRRTSSRGALLVETLRSEAAERARVEALLRRALAEDDLLLHYQPLYDLASGRATGVEALCRLRDEDGSLVPPGAFIPLAEQRGLVAHLGWQVLSAACAQLARWRSLGLDVEMSVNVAGEQAAQPRFAELVGEALAAHGCPPDRLVLELTESTVLAASSDTLAGMARVRELGVGIAIDDFGTRYASLHYVQHFPLTELKIDRSFVQGLPARRVERAIVAAVAGMAHALDLACVAEGVETREQHDALAGLGLRVRGQGYLLGRPAAAEQCEAMLRRPALG